MKRMEEVSLSKSQAQPHPAVAFLNVACTYVPNTKVECHYTLPPSVKPSARDWIGIFKVVGREGRAEDGCFPWGLPCHSAPRGAWPTRCSDQVVNEAEMRRCRVSGLSPHPLGGRDG